MVRKGIFSNFCIRYPQAFVFFELQTLCFLVFRRLVELPVLLFEKLEFYHILKQI